MVSAACRLLAFAGDRLWGRRGVLASQGRCRGLQSFTWSFAFKTMLILVCRSGRKSWCTCQCRVVGMSCSHPEPWSFAACV